MALTHWAFIYTAPGTDPEGERTEIDSGPCRTVVVGIERPEQGVDVARRLVDEGVQLIELCGAVGPMHAGRIIEAIEGAVPVGTVGYGPEAVDQLHAIFA